MLVPTSRTARFAACSLLFGFAAASASAQGRLVVWGQDGYPSEYAEPGHEIPIAPTCADIVDVAVYRPQHPYTWQGDGEGFAVRADGSLIQFDLEGPGFTTLFPAGTGFRSVGPHLAVDATGSVHDLNYKAFEPMPAGSNYQWFGSTRSGHLVGLDAVGQIVEPAWSFTGAFPPEIASPTGPGFQDLGLGEIHVVAIDSTGAVVNFGWPECYLSHGASKAPYPTFQNVPTGNDFVQVEAGLCYSLALRSNGKIEAWGSDDFGIVSNAPTGLGFQQIVASDRTAAALTANGSIVVWGHDGSGEVSNAPTGSGFTKIAASHDLFVAIAPSDCNANGVADHLDISSGTSLDCNANGLPDECDIAEGLELDHNGNGIPDSCDIAMGIETDCDLDGVIDLFAIVQRLVPDCNGNGVPDGCDLASGVDTDCDGNGVLDSCDLAQPRVAAWGRDEVGQVSDMPVGVVSVQVAAGGLHGLALLNDGSLVSWGDDSRGQVSGTPTGTGFTAVVAGAFHSLALRSDGSIESWGSDDAQQASGAPAGAGYTAIAAGDFHSLALDASGAISAWGSDVAGAVSGTPAGNGFTAIDAGERTSVALDSSGAIVAWGSDLDGQVTSAPTGTGFTAIAAGGRHGLVLDASGAITAWGRDLEGQVSGTPTAAGFTAIDAGGYYNLALGSDGVVRTWGKDLAGFAGAAPMGSGYTQVSAGPWLALALGGPALDLDGDGQLDQCNQPALSTATLEVSASLGGSQALALDAGPANAGRAYLLLGSASGTSPGQVVDGLNLPLNADAYFLQTLTSPGAPPLTGGLGVLSSLVPGSDPGGLATAAVTAPPGTSPSFVGLQLHHAFAVLDSGGTVSFTSNAVPLTVTP